MLLSEKMNQSIDLFGQWYLYVISIYLMISIIFNISIKNADILGCLNIIFGDSALFLSFLSNKSFGNEWLTHMALC